MFEYEVFLSFSAKDVTAVRPIWQRLMSSGLRVFWSDENLKAAPGKSFVSGIQNALMNSRDFVLYWTEHAKASPWVEEEYQTFYSQCYLPDKASRRLIIFSPLASGLATLPPFFRQLQAVMSIDQLITSLGGVDIDGLKAENAQLKSRVAEMQAEIKRLTTLSQQPARTETASTVALSRAQPIKTTRHLLSVHDKANKVHALINVYIEYPHKYPGGIGAMHETGGIRVLNGTAEVLLKWADAMRLQFVSSPTQRRDTKARYVYSVEAALYTGSTLMLQLVDDWNMRDGGTGLLFGETALGKTQIRFSDIDMIIPSSE